ASLRQALHAGPPVTPSQILRTLQSSDRLTRKLLLALGDGQEIEAVEMNTRPVGEPDGRKTICVSSQAGCAMGCVFCVTGQFGLAISLHAPDDELRTSLMPVNRRWPIREVVAAADAYAAMTGRRVSYEYTLMAGVHDADEQADALARLLAGRLAHVNLIPLNPT